MTIVYDRWGVLVHHGDALDVMRTLPDQHVDAVVTDPQYGLTELPLSKVLTVLTAWLAGDRDYVPSGKGFMGRGWDSFVPPPAAWDECFRVLKPGGHLLAFAATRTADLTGLAIRLAGFEYRDTLTWIYGKGFPKSRDIRKAIDEFAGVPNTGKAKYWDGWGTALKPGYEPIVLARKPLTLPVAASVLEYGTGGLNINECRVPGKPWTFTHGPKTGRTGGGIMGEPLARAGIAESHPSGRWPPNLVPSHAALIDSGTGEVLGDACADGCVEGCPVTELDRQIRKMPRFYPTFRYEPKASSSERPRVSGKIWPTVKPLALMRWLCKLVTPPNGVILDCFAGTGTTGQAATAEGFRAILIEQDADAIGMIRARLDGHPKTEAPVPGRPVPGPIWDLFSEQDGEAVT